MVLYMTLWLEFYFVTSRRRMYVVEIFYYSDEVNQIPSTFLIYQSHFHPTNMTLFSCITFRFDWSSSSREPEPR